MVFPIENYTRVWVRGRLIDVLKASREETSYGVTGAIQFIPQITDAIDKDLKQLLFFRPWTVNPDPVTGYFQIELPATNDPDINPVDFSYEVILPWGKRYLIKVPYDTPDLYLPGDPLHGEAHVLELSNVVPDPANPSGTVQILQGQRGWSIATITIDEASHLVGTYEDGKPWDAGVMPVVSVNGRQGEIVLTKADVGLNNVNNTADANKPISTSTQTALDGKQPLDSDLTAIAGLNPADNDVAQRKAGAWTNRTPAQLKTDLGLVKADVALGNVDNTSDVNKPVSTAQQTALNGKANSAHTHAISDTTNLQTQLDGKAAASHTHAVSDVTNLQTSLDNKPDSASFDTITQITQAAYDALGTKDSRTLYVVVG